MAITLQQFGQDPCLAEYPFDKPLPTELPLVNIVEITDTELIYRNEHGEAVRINLAVCADRYENDHVIQNRKDATYRCVGERSAGDHGYYEIRTEPVIYFCHNRPKAKLQKWAERYLGLHLDTKQFQSFYTIQKQLNAHGWTTLDLS